MASVAIGLGIEWNVGCWGQAQDSCICAVVTAVAALAADIGMVEDSSSPSRSIMAILAAVVGSSICQNKVGWTLCSQRSLADLGAAVVAGKAGCGCVGVIESGWLPRATCVARCVAILAIVVRIQMSGCRGILLRQCAEYRAVVTGQARCVGLGVKELCALPSDEVRSARVARNAVVARRYVPGRLALGWRPLAIVAAEAVGWVKRQGVIPLGRLPCGCRVACAAIVGRYREMGI